MIVTLDRSKKLLLLKWLKQGFIDTLDLPEAYEGGSLFLELLKASAVVEDPTDTTATDGETTTEQP